MPITPPISSRSFLRLLATGCLFAAALSSTSAADAASGPYRKVLFLGNSITKHGPKADIDWAGNWGMAATAEEKDYVHLVTQALTKSAGAAPEVMVRNIADLERQYADYDVPGKLGDALAFPADLVIVAIGENVPKLENDEARGQFKATVLKLLRGVQGERHPRIIVRGSFFRGKTEQTEILKAAAAEVGATFVDISKLGLEESNYARSERPYKNAGVANHPGDRGMQAIADAIVAAIGK